MATGVKDAAGITSAASGIAAVGDHPRAVSFAPRSISDPAAFGRYLSPLRYPGAKAGLNPVLVDVLTSSSATLARPVDLFVEPFAGGASASLNLLVRGVVQRVLLADADPMVAAFWQVAAADSARLIARMREEHAEYVAPGGVRALERWDYWRGWNVRPGTREANARFELAMKCLFLNRTTFSGILNGRAGPLGGRKQASAYTIGCRFSPDALADRITLVGHLYDAHRLVDVWRADWRSTMDGVASRYKSLVPDNIVAYLDPPYYEKSDRLYAVPNAGAAFDHGRLADYLRESARYRWILSYDHHPDLLAPDRFGFRRMRSNPLFGVHAWPVTRRLVTLNYSASSRRGRGPRDELLMTTLPPSAIPEGPRIRVLPV